MGDLGARREVVRRARDILAQRPVYLDTETTGLAATDEIVEICLVDDDGTVLLDSLVRPRGRISPEAMRVHGITERMVAGAPAWPEVWREVRAALSRRAVAIYNAGFDLRMIEQSHRGHGLTRGLAGLRPHCIMELYAAFHGERDPRYGTYRWQRLEVARSQCGIALPNAHRARADALLARAVLRHMGLGRG